MAAWLTYLKSRMMLPIEDKEEEHTSDELEEALKGDDKAEIETKTKDLTDASTNLAQKLYAEQQAQTDNAEGEAESGGQSEAEDAVDAEFEEVTEEDK